MQCTIYVWHTVTQHTETHACTHIHTNKRAHSHVNIQLHTHVFIHISEHNFLHIKHLCVHVHRYAHLRSYMHNITCLPVDNDIQFTSACTHTYLHINLCIHSNANGDSYTRTHMTTRSQIRTTAHKVIRLRVDIMIHGLHDHTSTHKITLINT